MKLLNDIFPQHERRGGGVFKNYTVSLFLGKPKDKSRDKSPKLIEDVTFKGMARPVFESFSDITFDSVGSSESPSHEVPKLTGERAGIQEMIDSFLMVHAKTTSGWTMEAFTRKIFPG